MSKFRKRTVAVTADTLDIGKAHADLALAIEEHRAALATEAAAQRRTAVALLNVNKAQKTFDAAVGQVKQKAAPASSNWWSRGRLTETGA